MKHFFTFKLNARVFSFIFFLLMLSQLTLAKSHLIDTVLVKRSKYELHSKRKFKFKLDTNKIEGSSLDDLLKVKRLKSYSEKLRSYLNRARALKESILKNDKLVGVIKPRTLLELPVGISKNIGGIEYMVMIDSVKLKPDAAYLNAMMMITIPRQNSDDSLKLVFAGKDIRFSSEGGLTGDARLELVGDIPIKLGKSSILNILAEGGKTFVEWDCNGFKGMGINAEVIFSRKYIVPDMPDGSQGKDHVKATFQAKASDWNDIITKVALPNFQVAKLKGFGFSVTDAYIDLSDLENPVNFKLPEQYPLGKFPDSTVTFWQGVFIREVRVSLPKHFSKRNTKKRTSFYARNLILDSEGITGLLMAENLINKDEGSDSKWQFTLDSLAVSIQLNQVKSAGFKGYINVPLFKGDLAYTAIINSEDDTYIFNAGFEKMQEVPLWQAKMEIYPSSYFKMVSENGKFEALANLNGKMKIETDVVKIPELNFEKFMIGTKSPYIGIGSFSLGSTENTGLKLASFPISISEVGFKSKDDLFGIQFTVAVNLVGKKSNAMGFSGKTQLTVLGKVEDDEGIQSYRYHTTEVNKINLNIDGGAFKLDGSIDFFRNDTIYGKGFQGMLNAEFEPGIQIQAMALFGNTGKYRYWYADGLFSRENGRGMASSASGALEGITLLAFGGGASYHMKRVMPKKAPKTTIGKTRSGTHYVPDEKIGLGIKAYVKIGTKKKEIFNGDASFEITFNANGGLKYIGFVGKAEFLSKELMISNNFVKKAVQKVQKAREIISEIDNKNGGLLKMLGGQDSGVFPASEGKGKAAMQATISIDYDVPNKTLHGDLEVFVNLANVIKGTGKNNSAGKAVIHFAPDKWYIHIGTPQKRLGLELLKVAKTGGYFMVGHDIPEMPPLPERVASMINFGDHVENRDENKLKNGQGLAFGTSIDVDTGDLTFLIFYARFALGAGFDVMLKNYGTEARCKGDTRTVGMNGWYAQGRAYAYVEGDIGVKVNLKFKKGKFKILSIAAAAVLEAKLPNPTWMRGAVGGNYNILGGLVKGKCRFEFTYGKKCEIVGGSALNGIEIISDVSPQEDAQKVDVFTTPQAAFSYPIGRVFTIQDVDDIAQQFKIKLDHFKLTCDGKEINASLEWNQENDVVVLKPFDVLPSEKEITLEVSVSFEEKKNGVWVVVKTKGKIFRETVTRKFKTDKAPDYIPWNNVAYTYPLKNQVNLYRNEAPEGYIVLKRGQPYLFETTDEWQQVLKLDISEENTKLYNLSYNKSEKVVKFPIPGDLKLGEVYGLRIVNLPRYEQDKIEANVNKKESDVDGVEGITITQKKLEGSIKNQKETNIISMHFRTSKYETFIQKLETAKIGKGSKWMVTNGIHQLSSSINLDETFGKFELQGGERCEKPLIWIEASLDNPWYQKSVYPLIYEGYPVLNLTVKRTVNPYGLPPNRAVYIAQDPRNITLSDETHELSAAIPTFGRITYDLPIIMSRDYMDLATKAANLSNNYNSYPWVKNIMNTPFPVLKSGDYKVIIKYILPGKNKVTSEKVLIINNP